MRPAVVMDTNVAMVANERADQASPDCITRCLDRLQKIRDAERIVLDDMGRIFDEYL